MSTPPGKCTNVQTVQTAAAIHGFWPFFMERLSLEAAPLLGLYGLYGMYGMYGVYITGGSTLKGFEILSAVQTASQTRARHHQPWRAKQGVPEHGGNEIASNLRCCAIWAFNPKMLFATVVWI